MNPRCNIQIRGSILIKSYQSYIDSDDPMAPLAVLCRDKLKDLFPELEWEIYHGNYGEHTTIRLKVCIRGCPVRWLFTVHFVPDHMVVLSLHEGRTKHLYISYGNPRLIDHLASELSHRILLDRNVHG